MARKMTDDEVMDYTYNKLFGDLDGIESGSMFKESAGENGIQDDPADHAGTPGVAGIDISIKPLMAGAAEGARNPEGGKPEPEAMQPGGEDDEDDKYKGIGKMSPLMQRLHGDR